MTHLELEIKKLKKSVMEMTDLTITQLEKSHEAFINMDADLAQEIIHNEKYVNAMELSIDRDCENIFALQNPVAGDLRFVISILKIISDLERIGDYANTIAEYVVDFQIDIDNKLIEALRVNDMFEKSIAMVRDVKEAFKAEDTKLARKTFKNDIELDEINKHSSKIIAEHVQNDPSSVRQALFLFSVIRKLERVGDHVTNIAEDLIFFSEAAVLKHKKLKKKLK